MQESRLRQERTSARVRQVESSAGRATGRRPRRIASTALAALIAFVAIVLLASPAVAQDPPPQEPGVTQRIFQLPHPLDEICTIKEAQTPNVDELKPTIDWEGDAAFGGLTDNFVVHAIANLTVPTAGTYEFRLTSDDGSELLIDDELVIDHDGLHGAEDMDGEIELTEGLHALRINYFEAGGGQELTLSWRPPGAAAFSVVPNSVLSTDAGVVRVTAPGSKECEGVFDTPGDGLPLDGVNPAYDLVNLRPAGFEPKVTGLEWMGDDLLVLTWGDDDGDPNTVTEAGEVWKLSGVKDADDPADVTPTKIAEGLQEPMGIKVVDGDIYISEKDMLSKLVDADSNGVYEATEEITTWPFDGNFHEFAFGILYKDGYFYVNLSVSINLGGATTLPQGSDDRGTHLKIDKDTGEIEYVAGGLRTPHGIGWGPEDEIFVTDNQGGWLPANKLIHVQPGKFYNHYTTGPSGPGRFDDQRPTPPALWLPHNEIANSPSQPMLIPDGPFAGQMWVADVTYGGVQRAFLEKVDGEYQGAYFRMTQGLESGITHMVLEDDGSIIVGGLGAGGNWGQAGKLGFGLQKLVPNGTETFDIHAMEVVEGGFDLTYTKPISEETLTDLAEKYEVEQWTYVPTSAYGGPKVNPESLEVTDATISADGQTVSLQIDGLRPNRVVYVRSPRPFEAEDGEELLSTEAWYTLNSLPGYVAPNDGLYELEDGLLTGGAGFDTEHPGFSGAGYVSGFGTVDASTQIEVNAAEAGDYRIALRYANGPNPFAGPKTITMIVNGVSRQITLPATGAWANYGLYVDDVALNAGANTIQLKHAAGDDGHVNLDSLRVAPAGTKRYEAEAATLAGGANVQTEHAGYSGDGYVGGYLSEGASTTFEVTALADAPTEVVFGYANGPNPFQGTKEVSLYVNGEFAKKLALPDTGAWDAYGTLSDTLLLQAGLNEISIRYDAGDDGNVNIDYLDLTQNEPIECEDDIDPNDDFDGDGLDPCRWNVIVRPNAGQRSVGDGKLAIETGDGTDMFGGNTTAENIVLQQAPQGPWEITTKVNMPFSGKDYEQAAMFVYGSDQDFVKLSFMNAPEGRRFEFTLQDGGSAIFDSNLDLSPVLDESFPEEAYLRIRNDGTHLTGFYSADGTNWSEFGRARALSAIPNPRVGVSAYNGAGDGNTAEFDFFHLEPITVEPTCTEAETPDPGYTMLFDGTAESFAEWEMAGPGGFNLTPDCTLETFGGLGMLYHPQTFDSPVTFRMDWMMPGDENSGVFVGNWGPDPDYEPNPAWDAVDHGYEIQIDPSDDPDSTTGAVYDFQAADAVARDAALNPPGEWNTYDITVDDPVITVSLNGVVINEFTSTDPERDLSATKLGLQNHGAGDEVYFRRIQVREGGPPVGEAELRASVKPKSKTVGKRKRTASFRFNVKNVGDGPTAGPLKLCAKAPRKRVRVVGKRCRLVKGLAAKESTAKRFKFKVRPKARGKKTRIVFVARGKGVSRAHAVARLRAR